ncbi:MAG: hypothetical protein QF371_02170, partial [Flavobacteriales bacterium]|nr:hypothetical protein [Flavobacteriales bacterium]
MSGFSIQTLDLLLRARIGRSAILLSVIFLLTLNIGCGVYSFTGASISPEVKSVSVDYIPSYAPLAPANMPQTFTEALRELFISRTNLDMLAKNGDI